MRTKSPWLALLTIIVVLFMLSPMLLSILAALVNQYSKGLESGLTLRWLSQVFDQYGSTVVASLLIAATCAVANALIGVPCAYALARAKGRWAKTFEELCIHLGRTYDFYPTLHGTNSIRSISASRYFGDRRGGTLSGRQFFHEVYDCTRASGSPLNRGGCAHGIHPFCRGV